MSPLNRETETGPDSDIKESGPVSGTKNNPILILFYFCLYLVFVCSVILKDIVFLIFDFLLCALVAIKELCIVFILGIVSLYAILKWFISLPEPVFNKINSDKLIVFFVLFFLPVLI